MLDKSLAYRTNLYKILASLNSSAKISDGKIFYDSTVSRTKSLFL